MGSSIKRHSSEGKRDDTKALEVLYDISQAVSNTRNLYDLYVNIHRALDTILTVDNFYIALYHKDKDSITFPYYVDEKDELPDEIFNFSQTASLTGQVIDSRQPMIFYEQDIIDFSRRQNQEVIGTVSKIWLGAPLIIKNRVIGALAIQNFDSPKAYQESDLFVLNTISQHIALAIERKETEEKFKEQQQVLETILESSPVGICLVENRIFKWVNTQMVKMLGYSSKSDLTDKSAAIIYGSKADYKAAGQTIESQMIKANRADFDYELVRKDGSHFKAHVIATGSGKGTNRIIGTIADLSQRERVHEERMEKERLQGVLEMAGAICHEINQPLQTILGYTTLFDTPETVTPKALEEIKSQANRIGKITKRLSKITRYETMSYPGDATIVDIWRSSN
ncbi:MAG: GAF domain-containing protein [Desulfobacter sp.]|nr:GAF domain-containing protein [Desulfobacter sp.]WDP84365.1 MAG: GAF domain-containing protein [Desulfobacter sp.]